VIYVRVQYLQCTLVGRIITIVAIDRHPFENDFLATTDQCSQDARARGIYCIYVRITLLYVLYCLQTESWTIVTMNVL
jgi:hypothetical protein